MNACYVDTSLLLAIAFGAPGAKDYSRALKGFDPVLSANLLECEFRAVFAREGVEYDGKLLERLTWILPDRRLTPEVDRVLSVGEARGADLWHLANALYVAEDPAEMGFFTADERQRKIARAVGFSTPE